MLEGTEIVYIARASQRRVMSINLMPGSRLPAWCASMGRVLLAALPQDQMLAVLERSDIRALTPHTKVARPDLLAELARVREQGYAVINQELELGLCSIAVPLKDMRGRVVAALNIGAPPPPFRPRTCRKKYLPAMTRMQEDLRSLIP